MAAENPQTRQMKPGDSFETALDSRGALGLQLSYKAEPADAVSVTRLEAPQDGKPQPGSPVQARFRIQALHPGKCRVTFFETQPWNKEFQPVMRQEIVLEISDGH